MVVEAGIFCIESSTYVNYPYGRVVELRFGDLPGAGNGAFSDVFEDQGNGHDLVCMEGAVVGDDAFDMHGVDCKSTNSPRRSEEAKVHKQLQFLYILYSLTQ